MPTPWRGHAVRLAVAGVGLECARADQGHARAGTVSKVIHQSAKGVLAANPSPPPIVNNFAADFSSAANKLSSSAHPDGGSASDVARSSRAYLKKVQRRAPARPQATT